MTRVLVAALMWVLVVSLLTLRRGRSDRSITYASLCIAVSMTLNINAVYWQLDLRLGGNNLTTLIADALLMVGIFFLGRGVMKAGDYRPGAVRFAVGRPTMIAALVGVVVAFFFIDRGSTTTAFMRDLGSQPAAAAYNMIEFTYCGVVVTAMLVLAARQYLQLHRWQRLSPGLLVVGSLFGIALCAISIVMDVAHVAGALDLVATLGSAYDVLSTLTFVFLCAGFVVQPGLRFLRQRFRPVRTDALVMILKPTWHRATAVRPGLGDVGAAGGLEDQESRLHRMVVEIRDAMIDRRAEFTVDAKEERLLNQAERHLLGAAHATVQADMAALPQHDPAEGRS